MNASQPYKALFKALAICAIFMSFMASITPLWANSADGTPIVICSTFGTKTITIDENGQEIPTPVRMNKPCTMCLVTDATVIIKDSYYAPPLPTLKSLRYASILHKTHTLNNSSPYAIRAPPIHS